MSSPGFESRPYGTAVESVLKDFSITDDRNAPPIVTQRNICKEDIIWFGELASNQDKESLSGQSFIPSNLGRVDDEERIPPVRWLSQTILKCCVDSSDYSTDDA
ncbi:hypothetical protein TNCV_47481 [Trichonephila clavipes]|nr:hypothetical protein TNCV_47481 [Trichonephila clavipes]